MDRFDRFVGFVLRRRWAVILLASLFTLLAGAGGMAVVFVLSMTLLPALLSVLPLRARPARSAQIQSLFFKRFGDLVVARRRFLIWTVGLVTIALCTGITRNEFNNNWTTQFDESYQIRRDSDFIMKNLTGLNSLEYSLSAGREGGITDPDYLHKVDAFANWYREQPEVTHVQAFPDIMKRLNKNMHGDDPAFHRLPENSELAAQYLLLYELSIPFGSDLNDRIDVGKSATRVTVTVRDLSDHAMRELDVRAQTWLRANVPEFESEATGITMIFAHLTARNIDAILLGTTIGMVLISLILIVFFKSLRLGLISLVPNFIPPVLGFGLWGHLVGEIDLSASVSIVIAFGIVVDDTIHFLSKYRDARSEGLSSADAVRSTFNAVGPALFTTTAVLSAGFLLMFLLSGFSGIWILGAMVASMVFFGLFIDFLLLPPMLMALERRTS